MFGSVNSEVVQHLEFALQGVQGERGHKLEPNHNDSQLKLAEDHIRQALQLLEAYSRKVVK